MTDKLKNKVRNWLLIGAEAIDSYRIIPRLILAGYAYIIYDSIKWYQKLKPYIIQGCNSTDTLKCIIELPSTQQTLLLSSVFGIAGLVTALYLNSGRNWDNYHKNEEEKNKKGDE